MSTITIHLPRDAEETLRAKAARTGQTVESYLRRLVERDAAGSFEATDDLSADEFERLLDELAAGKSLPPLPADFSRADIYQGHD